MKKLGLTLFLCGAFALNASAAEESVAVSSAQLNVSKAKTDVLGRHNSKVRNTPQAFVKADVAKPRVLAKDAYYPSEERITATRGIFEHRNGKRWYALNNKNDIPESEYLKEINEIEDNDAARNKFMKDHKTSYGNSISESQFKVTKAWHVCLGKETCIENVPTYGDPSDEDVEFVNYLSVMKKTNLYNQTIASGKKGKNIGIAFTENAVPLPTFSADYILLGNCRSTTYTNETVVHGVKVYRTLKRVAPEATLYGVSTSCMNESFPVALPIDGYKKSPKIYIGNHSYGDGLNKYDPKQSAFIDDFVYNTRTIEFASAGNWSHEGIHQISAVARGVNVIAVGAVHNNFTYDRSSSWSNSHYVKKDDASFVGEYYVKPEIANISDLLFPNDGVAFVENRDKPNQTSKLLEPYFRMTSASTPYTAASVALLLDRFPFYKWHPEVVKALMLTSSIMKIDGAKNHDSDNEGKYAMGIPDGNAMFEKNRSRFWNGNNEDFFKNGKITFTESGIQSGRKYRIAIAWLSSGTAVAQYGRLPQNIDLKVRQDGSTLKKSNSTANPFELVEVTAKSGGNLEIIIERKEGKDNLGGRVLLGYNFLELPEAYQKK